MRTLFRRASAWGLHHVRFQHSGAAGFAGIRGLNSPRDWFLFAYEASTRCVACGMCQGAKVACRQLLAVMRALPCQPLDYQCRSVLPRRCEELVKQAVESPPSPQTVQTLDDISDTVRVIPRRQPKGVQYSFLPAVQQVAGRVALKQKSMLPGTLP